MKFLHLYTKGTSDCLPEKDFNRCRCGITGPWNRPWQWGVNSQFTLNYIFFPLYLYAVPPQETRPYTDFWGCELCSIPKLSLPAIQIRMWQKCALTPLHPHTPFFFPRKRALKGDVAFAQVSSWHGGWLWWEADTCSCTWELANVPRSGSVAHAGRLRTLGSARSSHKVKRQMPILTHSSKDKDKHRTVIALKQG